MLHFLKRLFGKPAAEPPPGGERLQVARAGRQRVEQGLRDSEEHFREVVAGVRDHAIFLLDPQGRIVTWNAGAERLKGYRAAEIIGQHFSRFYPKEAVASGWPEEELRRAAAEGRLEDEGWRVRQDGTRFWANVVITALHDGDGQVRGYLKITRDMTDRKQAEENARRLLQEEAARKAAEGFAREIERQREQLHVTLASIGDAVIVTDTNGDVTFLNRVAAGLTGWEPHEAAGQPLERIFRIINEETRQPVDNPVATVFRERRVVALANHTALIARDGREVPIEDTAAPIQVADGAPSGAVLVFRDVTQARRAMEARLRLAAIVESSDDAIISQSLDGRILSWNHGAQQLYGYTAAEIIGQPLTCLVPPDHPDELPDILARLRRGERLEHFETQRVRKDGSRVEVSLTISPLRDAEGKVIGASKIARDITARKEEERRKDEFLALLAHELRNPLAPLRSGLEVLRLAGNDPAALESVRSMMERQLQHLIRLVDDLLDVSRISRGKLRLRKERLPLAEVVRHALEVCGPLVHDRGHELTVDLPPEPMQVDADKTRLAQVLCNLLNNAAKYSDPGSPIRLAVAREGQEAVLRVTDAGLGIPSHMLTQVFDLFTQVNRTLEKAQGGLGVGLTIVKRLVELHGGSVQARSDGYGKGSEFVIRLPLAPSRAAGRHEGNDAQAEPPSGRRTVLVADDNRDAADSLALMLSVMGHEVRTAYDGEAALAAAREFRPDVAVLDIGMPRLNGYEVCRRFREEPWGKGVLVVALTGWGQEEDKRRSHEAGFDAHLVKPVDPAAVEHLLAERLPKRG